MTGAVASGAFPLPLGDDTHVWRASLDRSDTDLSSLAHLLAPDEQLRASRFHFDRDRRHFVAARGLLRRLIGQYVGCAGEELEFLYGPQGKPALVRHTELQFNVAHSHGTGLFAFTLRAPIGVDLEYIRAIEHAALSSRFFSAAECAVLAAVPATARQDAFFTCWTRKEAYVKALGGGLSVPLDRFDVAAAPQSPARLLADRGDPDAVRSWALHDIDAAAGFRAALAVRKPHSQVRVFET